MVSERYTALRIYDEVAMPLYSKAFPVLTQPEKYSVAELTKAGELMSHSATLDELALALFEKNDKDSVAEVERKFGVNLNFPKEVMAESAAKAWLFAGNYPRAKAIAKEFLDKSEYAAVRSGFRIVLLETQRKYDKLKSDRKHVVL